MTPQQPPQKPDAGLSVTGQNGRVILTAKWGDPAKPMVVPFVLSPQAAFHLANEIRVAAENEGMRQATYPATIGRVPAGKPAPRPNGVIPLRPVTGPQTSADGASPQPAPAPATPPNDLVGDDFPVTDAT